MPQLAITVRNRDICILRQFIEITADVNLSHKISAAMFATAKYIPMFRKMFKCNIEKNKHGIEAL